MKEHKLFIGGRWIGGPAVQEVKNPFNQEAVGRVHQAGEAEIEAAVESAAAAFAETRRMAAHQRAAALAKITEGIAARKEDLARMISLEAGKPIREARTEAGRSVLTFQTAQEEAKRMGGEVVPLDLVPGNERRAAIVRRFPIGPILGITPFNFPLNLVAHKVAPALASGNTIILKPAPKTPITALLLAEIVESAGFPAGTLNVVPTTNDLAGRLVADDRIRMVSFTGSAPVGWMLKAKAGKKKIVLELGGNAGVIVHSDADLELASRRCAGGGFSYAGQTCISVQRIYVQETVLKPFLDQLVSHVSKLQTGDPLSDETNVGPLIDPKAAERTERWVAEAVREGAKLAVGGKRKGPFFEPTVLTDVKPSMKVCSEEVFAPLVMVMPYRSFDDAIGEVNRSPYGLQAGVFTRDIRLVFKAYEEIEVGGLMINEVSAFRVDPMPYGGVKDSGFGREGIRYAMESMTEMKLLAINPG
jgi:acyl-CoA reductase-like NAD-dependent aldehyde dehydrogenase